MKFIDDQAIDDLAKSSTILQCIVSFLEHEAQKSHAQLEIIWVQNNTTLIDMDKMNREQIQDACIKVNKQFQRIDKRPTCYIDSRENDLVRCEAFALSQYVCLT